ncbi:9810_t:CDS:2 [Acaulospora colombiana]|uniref:9810_t:CDS:1 n=1 Tax=Acaulospora colombiana TaxID=27376 RepID=A0ACA9MJK6_9GLOM|nr:9810_t:CDS:2 [Acaulospora colombiana]
MRAVGSSISMNKHVHPENGTQTHPEMALSLILERNILFQEKSEIPCQRALDHRIDVLSLFAFTFEASSSPGFIREKSIVVGFEPLTTRTEPGYHQRYWLVAQARLVDTSATFLAFSPILVSFLLHTLLAISYSTLHPTNSKNYPTPVAAPTTRNGAPTVKSSIFHDAVLVVNEKIGEVYTRAKPSSSSSRRTWWYRVAAYIVVACLILIAIIVGAVVGSRKGDSDGGTGSTGSGGGNGGGNNGSGEGPSFPTDSRLHKSFWGIAYTPRGAIDCTADQDHIKKDIMQLSQLTTRLRLYAADWFVLFLFIANQAQLCHPTHFQNASYLSLDVHPDVPSYTSQVALLDFALLTYGTSRIAGITVGNEYVLNAPSRGDSIPNAVNWVNSRIIDYKAHLRDLTASPAQYSSSLSSLTISTPTALPTTALAARSAAPYISPFNTLTRRALSPSEMNFTSIPVGTSDAAGTFLDGLVTTADYLFVNIHPWFSQNTFAQAGWFSWSYMRDIVVPMVNATWPANPSNSNGDGVPKQLFQGEFGWPTGTDSAPLGINPAGSPAGLEGLQKTLDDWVCAANRNGTQYFWFEAYDEPWKAMYGGVEQHWGLFDYDGNLKDITIPDCGDS